MPKHEDRGKSKDGSKKKFSAVYDDNEGKVSIWYKEGRDPGANGFAAVVEGLRLARAMVQKALFILSKEPDSALARKVLDYHFGGKQSALSNAETRMNPSDWG